MRVRREDQSRSDLPEGFLPSARRPRKNQHHERTPRAVSFTASGCIGRRLAVLPPPFGERHHESDHQSAKLAISRVARHSLRVPTGGRPRAGDCDTVRSASCFRKLERRSRRCARRRSARGASYANLVDWKFDRAVEIDRVVFSLHRRGLVGEKRFESKRPIFGTVLPGPALSRTRTINLIVKFCTPG